MHNASKRWILHGNNGGHRCALYVKVTTTFLCIAAFHSRAFPHLVRLKAGVVLPFTSLSLVLFTLELHLVILTTSYNSLKSSICLLPHTSVFKCCWIASLSFRILNLKSSPKPSLTGSRKTTKNLLKTIWPPRWPNGLRSVQKMSS
ncbi:hypothetical protein F4604DRAFT_940132 [Suillus subluteus]|nr:hypothetical protein F4604DRAFT_940132 [Suillus subluteus]